MERGGGAHPVTTPHDDAGAAGAATPPAAAALTIFSAPCVAAVMCTAADAVLPVRHDAMASKLRSSRSFLPRASHRGLPGVVVEDEPDGAVARPRLSAALPPDEPDGLAPPAAVKRATSALSDMFSETRCATCVAIAVFSRTGHAGGRQCHSDDNPMHPTSQPRHEQPTAPHPRHTTTARTVQCL